MHHNFFAFNAKVSLNIPGVKYFVFAKIFMIQCYSVQKMQQLLVLGRLVFQTPSKYANLRKNSKPKVQRGELGMHLHIPPLCYFVVLYEKVILVTSSDYPLHLHF